jgi:large repetitive protein
LGDTAYYTNTTTDTKNIVAGWYWGFDNGDSANTQHGKYLYTDTGTYTVALATYTTQGCTDTVVKPAITLVKPKPQAGFSIVGMDSSGYYYKFLFANNSAGADFYLWNFGNGQQSADDNPLHEYYKSGKYTIQLSASNNVGCEDSYDTTITLILPIEVYIPNAFTPGGNNTLNPVFKIAGISNIKDFEMLIFDRWGELLFKSNNIEQGWDGTYKNEALPDGAYLYMINIITEGRTLSYRGSLTLLR